MNSFYGWSRRETPVTDRPRALAVLIAVFLLGGILGSAGSYLWLRNRPIPANRAMQSFPRNAMAGRRLTDFLNLTPEQEAKRKEIMAESFKQLSKLREKQEPLFRGLDDLRKEQEPQIEAILAEANSKMMAILNPEQQKKFSEFMNDMQNMRHHGGRGMGPPPPMGSPDRRQQYGPGEFQQ
jgi:Spy/CpxP family protein refolding chaperone